MYNVREHYAKSVSFFYVAGESLKQSYLSSANFYPGLMETLAVRPLLDLRAGDMNVQVEVR